MGCRCNERASAMRQGVQAIRTGNVAAAAQAMRFVTRTMIEDARSGDLRRAAEARLAAMRPNRLR